MKHTQTLYFYTQFCNDLKYLYICNQIIIKVGRRKRQLPKLEDITIEAIAAEGKAIAHIEDKVLFVGNTVPGDIVDIQITRKKKTFLEGRVINYKKLSKDRTEPACIHFGTCGGCKWQMLPYEKQLEAKQQQVEDALNRIAKIELPEISPILGSENIYNYRNKLEFTFSNRRWFTPEEIGDGIEIKNPNALGFHIPKLFDKILDIEECHLQASPSNELRNWVREYALENNLSFYNIRNHEGFLRNLIIRNSVNGEIMVILSVAENLPDELDGLLKNLLKEFPQISSLMYVINEKKNDTINDLEIKCFAGKDHMIEQMEDLKFKVGPKSFYQTNSLQALELYRKTREFAQLSGKEIVYDLYTGTGTIANFVAHQAKKVIGIEYVPEAIEDAKVNSELNAIDNTSFYAGDMKDILNEEFIAENGAPDVVILDPPRAGIHAKVIEVLLAAKPKRIVYVSCNPATQARDLALMDSEYKVTAVQPVDMFPHTHHVENIVILDKK